MIDYSQCGEQAAILAAFNGATETIGRALDIGAWNAKTFSNTRALYELGWSLTMIEPSPAPMLGLLEEYGESERVTLVQACMGIEPGLVDLHVSDDAVSTSDGATFEKWKAHAKFMGRMMVPVLTWEDISNRFGGFDMVSIDAEGQSSDLFLRMLHLGIFPHCVVVEHDERTTELLSAATPHHYKATFVNQTNLVLIR